MKAITIKLPPEGVVPEGIIQFVHGMCEHKGRYEHILEHFSEKGFICAIADLKGHGENVTTSDDLGYFGKNGDRTLVEETHDFSMYLKREYPDLPLILVGHSMGSLIARAYIKKYDSDIDLLILSGSPSANSAAAAGQLLIRVMALFMGWRYRSPLIAGMVTGQFEKPFEKEGIKNAWVCSDPAVVDRYNKDPLCGFMFTLNGYYCLLSLMRSVYARDGWKKKNPDLRIAFLSGSADPCRVNDRAFHAAVNHLKNVGYKNTAGKLYPGLRHEIFNEKTNYKVFSDMEKIISDTI